MMEVQQQQAEHPQQLAEEDANAEMEVRQPPLGETVPFIVEESRRHSSRCC